MDFLLSLLLIPFAVPLALGFMTMCCCTGGCVSCTPGTITVDLQVDISGYADNASSGCTGCSDIDGTWILEYHPYVAGNVSCPGDTTNDCQWALHDPNPAISCSGSTPAGIGLVASHSQTTPTTTTLLRLLVENCEEVGGSAVNEGIHFYDEITSTTGNPDCNSFSGLTPTINHFLTTGQVCDPAAVTITINAI